MHWKRYRAIVIGAVCAVGLLGLGTAPASAQALTGETLSGQGTFNAQPSSTCNPDGTGTINFTASGTATGPFPGTFTETEASPSAPVPPPTS